jgi:hypothetical protein
MERLREAAYESVLRGCGFAALAILCFLVGMSFDPLAMMRGGGVLTTLTGFVLLLKAWAAPSRDYRTTEMWLYVKKADRPPASIAQKTIGAILAEAYNRAALYAFGFAIAFWSLALACSMARRVGLIATPLAG